MFYTYPHHKIRSYFQGHTLIFYANFDFQLDQKTLTEMAGYIERSFLEDKAKHKYSLEDYGLDEAEVHNKLNYS